MDERTIREASGHSDMAQVEEIEIIFTPVTVLGGLSQCIQLRRLSVMSTGLRRISNLDCLGRTLLHLNLSNQELTAIENLRLPHLRELLLHRNSITKVEGLDGCPRLQKLWLCSNKIVSMENLQGLGALRELWLQDNRICRVRGLEFLGSLQSLGLAANQIADFKDIQQLGHLPALNELSLVDSSFGDCPIARAEGYRSFILCHLKHVRVLDSIPITDAERGAAEEACPRCGSPAGGGGRRAPARGVLRCPTPSSRLRSARLAQDYMQRILQFNQRIDDVCQHSERELLAIKAQRRRQRNTASELRQQLLEARRAGRI